MQRCQEREAREEGAQENTALLSKGASLPFLSLQALLFVTGHGLKPWKTDYAQEQGFNFQPGTRAARDRRPHGILSSAKTEANQRTRLCL